MAFSRLFALLCALVPPVALAVNPLVHLSYSSYQGTAQSNAVTSWLGIRFAAPPLGNLRFKAPQDPENNSTVQIANKHGPLCISTGDSPTDNTTSEDCLFLDVYAPSNAKSSSKLPVYLWIQGGGYNADSNANYRGDGLIIASGMDIVVVTFNYRVSLYGFLASKEIAGGGDFNIGLLDQRKVMQWVQKYISQFGGDPGHVTIGGASAGAGSIALQLTAYGGKNEALFAAAAAESQFFPLMLTIPQAQFQYDELVNRTGCTGAKDTLACLRSLNTTWLQRNNVATPYPGLGPNATAPLFYYVPVIDGTLVETYTDRLMAAGKFVKVPVIFGDDTNEGTLFAPKAAASYAAMNQFLVDQYPQLTPAELKIVDSLYPVSQPINGSGAYWQTAANAYGEACFICWSLYISSAYATYSNKGNWDYHYDVLDPAAAVTGTLVSHTIEIPAIWGPGYAGAGPASLNTTNANIVPVMQAYWTSFIRTYNPNTHRAPGSPEWKTWTNWAQDRIYLQTNGTRMETVPQDQQKRCKYWATLEVQKW